ncbi:MAG: peptide chain release factor 2 [Firmicutes bacterium]|nr:peptide chain release factor 2 [Bacillota bacterium]
MLLTDLKAPVQGVLKQIEDLRLTFDLEAKRREIAELEGKMSAPDFWDDQSRAQKIIQALNSLRARVERWEGLHKRGEDLQVLLELGLEEDDQDLAGEIETSVGDLQRDVDQMQLDLMLSGKYDRNNAILAIHPGAGGTESQDWAEMLLRMYTRWGEKRGYQVETLDLLPGDEAGLKSATLMISGENAYGYLKAEKGVHRLVRISPFDASGRRHTSFASVDVLPEVDDDTDIVINPVELKIDTYRSSSAGGQHVNKTESAIRITHLPTGIIVQCQNERSQHSNRESAMKILRARLLERRLAEQQEQINALRGEHGEIAWGNQIRSYVFCPYTMVKDHRTEAEMGNVNAVMDGEIDPFIEAFLKQKKV